VNPIYCQEGSGVGVGSSGAGVELGVDGGFSVAAILARGVLVGAVTSDVGILVIVGASVVSTATISSSSTTDLASARGADVAFTAIASAVGKCTT